MSRYLVTGFCRLTGLWRDYVLASSAEEAVRVYCDTYGMEPEMCAAVLDRGWPMADGGKLRRAA
jgi:hypothetical protein